MIKPVSVQKVMAILKKDGHPKADGTFLTTFTNGYVARKGHVYPHGAVVRVSNRDKKGDFGRRYDDSAEIAAYKASLEACGVVIVGDHITEHAFLCTGIKED